MKYLLLLLLTACATKMPMPPSMDGAVMGLTEQKQEEKLWCAAASSRMLMSQYRSVVPQCELASKHHGENCCTSNSVKCTKEVLIENILPKYGLKVRQASPSFDTAWNLVRSGKAVAIYHLYLAGTDAASGHSVIAYWAYEVEGKKYLMVYDPLIGGKRVWDDTYVVGNLAWYRLLWVDK